MAPTQNSRSLSDNDALVEILIRLSVKDLSRFKCVCTHWHSLISSPIFVSSHLNRSVSNPSSHWTIVEHSYSKQPIPPDPFKSVIYPLSLGTTLFVGSINGLICVVGCETNKPDAGQFGRSSDDIWIWNPSTKNSKKLPLGKLTSPTKVTFSFGWDSIANDYKVLKMVSKGRATLVEVWASNSNSWREIKVDHNFSQPDCMARVSICDAVVQGFAYCIVMDDLENLCVASFNMRTEVLQLLSMPKLSIPFNMLVASIADKRKHFFCMNWKGNFAFAEIVSTAYPMQMYHLWTMDGGVGKELWSKKFSFHIDDHFTYCMNSNINGKLVLKGNRRGLISYDVETQETKTIGNPNIGLYVVGAYDYVGSLVSIEGFNPLGEDMIRMINVIWP